jgi:hypothetical protein
VPCPSRVVAVVETGVVVAWVVAVVETGVVVAWVVAVEEREEYMAAMEEREEYVAAREGCVALRHDLRCNTR